MFDSLESVKADAKGTGGGFTVVEFSTSRAPSVPLHTNDRWDTGFYILDGEYSFVVADETVAASPGTWVYVPRETPHAWRCQAGESVPEGVRRGQCCAHGRDHARGRARRAQQERRVTRRWAGGRL